MHDICPKVGVWGGAEIGLVRRLLEFAEKPSIANGKKHVALDITKKVISLILAPKDLGHPLPTSPSPSLSSAATAGMLERPRSIAGR